VYALGDCARNDKAPLPALASVAEQQGTYLSNCFNEHYANCDVTNKDAEVPPPGPVELGAWPPYPQFLFKKSPTFRYISKGSMINLGKKGLADMSKGELGGPTVSGLSAFLMWRGYYFSRQFSWANMILVPMFWFKSLVFGRDISRF
jgi:NADH dehydrogenase FAD-containing subunit